MRPEEEHWPPWPNLDWELLDEEDEEKRFDPGQPRWPRGTPRGGEWRDDLTPGLPEIPSGPPVDTPQQRMALRTNPAARKVRKKYPPGTRVASIGGTPPRRIQEGTVVRHIPATNSQGGTLVVQWDSGHTGRLSPISVEKLEPEVASGPPEGDVLGPVKGPRIFFHVSPAKVDEVGISFPDRPARATEPGNYVFDNLPDALAYREFWSGRDLDLYAVDTRDVTLRRDPLVEEGAWVTDEDIPANRVRRIAPEELGEPSLGGAMSGEGLPKRATLRDTPPKFVSLQPGEYESTDGRFRLARLQGVNPPAWNVELSTDYWNELLDADAGDLMGMPDTLIVDGAASKRDAEELFADEWPELVERLRAREQLGGDPTPDPPDMDRDSRIELIRRLYDEDASLDTIISQVGTDDEAVYLIHSQLGVSKTRIRRHIEMQRRRQIDGPGEGKVTKKGTWSARGRPGRKRSSANWKAKVEKLIAEAPPIQRHQESMLVAPGTPRQMPDPSEFLRQQHERIMEIGAVLDAHIRKETEAERNEYQEAKARVDGIHADLLKLDKEMRAREDVMAAEIANTPKDEMTSPSLTGGADPGLGLTGVTPEEAHAAKALIERYMVGTGGRGFYDTDPRDLYRAFHDGREITEREKLIGHAYWLISSGDPERERILDRQIALEKENAGIRSRIDVARAAYITKRREVTLEAMKKLREMGGVLTYTMRGHPDDAVFVREGLYFARNVLPGDWIKSSNDYEAPLAVEAREGERAYYADRVVSPIEPFVKQALLTTHEDRAGAADVPDMAATTTHELTHRMEYAHPTLTPAEWAFHEERTKGGRTRALYELEWDKGYDTDEITKPDDFVNAYSGKVYRGELKYRRTYEVLTMGIEDYMTDELGFIDRDGDYRQFVLGALAFL